MRALTSCPVCEGHSNEGVAEFNGLLAHAEMRETELCRYDYRLCHRCGTVFAGRRPTGGEYELLYGRFNEMLHRAGQEGPIQHEGPLTDALTAELDRNPVWWRAASVDGDLGSSIRKEIRLQVPHLAPLVSHCQIQDARVLEIRTKVGFLASFLKEVLGARDACVMTTWPIQQALVERLPGVQCATGAHAEHLSIPFEGPFDVVIAPHVYTHAAHPEQFFAEIRRVLAPRGWLYLCQEPDDTRLSARGKNLFSELKCFHFQQVDQPAYNRALQVHGFAVAASGYKEQGRSSAEMWALGRLSAKARLEPIGEAALHERRALYTRWRDESILALPPHLQQLFGAEVDDISRRAVARGYATMKDGTVQVSRAIYMVYPGDAQSAESPVPAPDAVTVSRT